MSPFKREILAGGSASLAFLGLWSALQLSLLPAVGLAAVVYAGVRLLIPNPPDPGQVEVAVGITQHQLDAARSDILERAARFESIGQTVAKPVMAKNISEIGRIVRELMIHFDRDPENLRRAQDFLVIQLPKAQRIVERYAWLASQRYLDDTLRSELDEAERTVLLIEQAFEKQHNRLLLEDVREFNVDRRVFEELLQLDTRLDLAGRSTTERIGE